MASTSRHTRSFLEFLSCLSTVPRALLAALVHARCALPTHCKACMLRFSPAGRQAGRIRDACCPTCKKIIRDFQILMPHRWLQLADLTTPVSPQLVVSHPHKARDIGEGESCCVSRQLSCTYLRHHLCTSVFLSRSSSDHDEGPRSRLGSADQALYFV